MLRFQFQFTGFLTLSTYKTRPMSGASELAPFVAQGNLWAMGVGRNFCGDDIIVVLNQCRFVFLKVVKISKTSLPLCFLAPRSGGRNI